MDQLENHKLKIKKYLGWCDGTYLKIIEHSESESQDELEKEFVTLLGYICSIHESLIFIGKKILGLAWANSLEELREQDELLYYFWNARNKVTHDSLISWRFSMGSSQIRVVDPELLQDIIYPFAYNSQPAMLQLFCFLYGAKNWGELIKKIEFDKVPTKEKLVRAGVAFNGYNRTFVLTEFKAKINGKLKTVKEPSLHLGKAIVPSANLASKNVIGFYKSKLEEVEQLNNQAFN